MKHFLTVLCLLFVFSFSSAQVTFTSLKEALKSPNEVERLDLSGQNLKALPKKIKVFVNLKVLDLSSNQLNNLPGSFAELTNLDSLNLKDNSFRTIPSMLLEMGNLKWVSLKLNPAGAKSLGRPDFNLVGSLYDLWKDQVTVEVDAKTYDPSKGDFAGPEDYDVAHTQPEPKNLQELINKIKEPDVKKSFSENGLVVIRLKVDDKGNYAEHRVVKSSDEALLTFLEVEVRHLKFSPATWNGEPKSFWINIPFKSRY